MSILHCIAKIAPNFPKANPPSSPKIAFKSQANVRSMNMVCIQSQNKSHKNSQPRTVFNFKKYHAVSIECRDHYTRERAAAINKKFSPERESLNPENVPSP